MADEQYEQSPLMLALAAMRAKNQRAAECAAEGWPRSEPADEPEGDTTIVGIVAHALSLEFQSCPDDPDHIDAAQSLLFNLAAAGYVIVPREPTEAMIEAGDGATKYWENSEPGLVWRAMIAAAPNP